MPIKTSGAEFKRFYADPTIWPADSWHEDVIFLVNGQASDEDFDMTKIADQDVISMAGGIVLGGPYDGHEPTIETLFKRWRKKQSVATLVIEFDVSKREQVLAAIKSAGAKSIG